MPMLRIMMKQLQEIIRLKFDLKLSNRNIGRMLNVSPSTVSLYLSAFKRKGIAWDPNSPISQEELEKLLCPTKHLSSLRELVVPDFEQIHLELKKKVVTLQLLWEEYHQVHGEKAYGRTQFCKMYQQWRKKLKVTMRQKHKAGDKLFIDYAGSTIPIIDAASGEIKRAQIFVAVMGASNYTYAEATWTQSLPDWISSHVHAFEYFGGVTALLVPDNLKSAINKACRYDPEVNATYADMAEYYSTAVLPARPYKARDKAKAEVAVQIVGRWILARLRNIQFFSLVELNRAIQALLIELNNKPFKKLPGTRLSQFQLLDKPVLRPLPNEPYVYAEFRKARLGIDYHIEIEGHYYSAPYRLAKEEVQLRTTKNTVEVFYQNKRVASHIRSYKRGFHTTLTQHMPTRHQKHLDWTPGRFLNWAKTIGPETLHLTKQLLEKKAHPEQGYRSCLGLLNLAKNYGQSRLEAACRRAIHFHTPYRKSVDAILKKNLDKQPLPEESQKTSSVLHENIRGPKYFATTFKEEMIC